MSPLYLARRLVHLMVTALVVSLLVFGITQILPANAATILLGEFATLESLVALEAKLGLDRPAYVQYLDWIGGVLRGDLGVSLRTDLPVAPTVFEALGRSLTLAALALAGYVAAAVARGESAGWIMLREVLPNMLAPVIIETTIRVAFAVMLLATLSFLGLGSQPPAPEWGLMISEARGFMFRSAWTIFWPGLAIATVAVTFNLLGDALRDALNPRTRG